MGWAGRMIIEPECLTERDSYTVEEIVGTILQIAIKHNYIKREDLTTKGEKLFSEAKKHEPDNG